MLHAISLVLVLSGVGAVFGLLLAFADKKLAVDYNPLIDEVEEELPKGQCGGCGFAGCRQYAEAVVNKPDVSPGLCGPGGPEVAQIIARLTNKAPGDTIPMKAVAMCAGSIEDTSMMTHFYDGLNDCMAASLLYAGEKACEYGCLGLGTCVRACPYNAIHMNDRRLPDVHHDKCMGCGVCVSVCPRSIMQLVPDNARPLILCRNHQKGKSVRHMCKVGCIACGNCVRTCPHGAIEMIDKLPVIDYKVCESCDLAVCLVSRCVPKTIQPYFGVEVPDIEPPKPTPKKKPASASSSEKADSETAKDTRESDNA